MQLIRIGPARCEVEPIRLATIIHVIKPTQFYNVPQLLHTRLMRSRLCVQTLHELHATTSK